jgi:hypothetical protein
VNISDLSVIENPLELKSNNLKKDMLIYRWSGAMKNAQKTPTTFLSR